MGGKEERRRERKEGRERGVRKRKKRRNDIKKFRSGDRTFVNTWFLGAK